MELDSPWLLEGGNRLLVNGVDVVPLVEAALNARFPGRELRLADDPSGLAAAWAALEQTWAATLERAKARPVGTLHASVDGEWSFTQDAAPPRHGHRRLARPGGPGARPALPPGRAPG